MKRYLAPILTREMQGHSSRPPEDRDCKDKCWQENAAHMLSFELLEVRNA